MVIVGIHSTRLLMVCPQGKITIHGIDDVYKDEQNR